MTLKPASIVGEESPLLHDACVAKDPAPRSAQASRILPSLVGVFLASADTSLLIVTQDEIASSFHNVSSAPLLLIAYNLGFCIALPVYGGLSDIYGCRNFLLSAYGIFAIGCLISGLTTAIWPFIGGRVLAGIGGAGMTELISVLIIDMFGTSQVPIIRSYVLTASMAGRVCGGPLGGFLTDTVGWRWSLACQTPIALFCLAISAWQLPQTATKSHLVGSKELPTVQEIDFPGSGTFSIFMISFILLLNHQVVGSPEGFPILHVLLSSFILSGVAFVLIESFWAKYPIVPLRIFRIPTVGWKFLTQILLSIQISTILSNLGPFFSRAGISKMETAIRIWPTYLGFMAGAVIAGKVISKRLKYQRLSIVAVSIIVTPQAILTLRWGTTGIQGLKILYLLPWSIGLGLLLSAQFIALTDCSPKDQLASITGVYNLSQQIGTIIGTSLSSALLRLIFRHQLSVKLLGIPDLERKQHFIQNILDNPSFAATLPQSIQSIIHSSYLQAFQSIPLSSFCWGIFLLPLAIFNQKRNM